MAANGLWTPDGQLLAAQTCGDTGSRLVRHAGSGVGQVVFETGGVVTGLLSTGADVYLNMRDEVAELVVIDGL